MSRSQSEGFTYLFVLILVAALAGTLTIAATQWSVIDQRKREAGLLRSGATIRSAIGAYYESSPGTVKRYPPSLEALLRDERYLAIRRHLRKIPLDPMTQQSDWGLAIAPDGGVMGVYSRSSKSVFKTGNFSIVDKGLATGSSYSDWRFVYIPAAPSAPTSGALIR